jgi:hypothetical protein
MDTYQWTQAGSKNLWQLLHSFKAELLIQETNQVSGIREGDQSLISKFFWAGYRGKDLKALNIVQRFRNLLHLSDIVKCDGQTLDEFITSEPSEISGAHTFSQEHPTEADFWLWNIAMDKLCSGTTSLQYALGCFLRKPHLTWSWFTTADADFLYQESQTIPSSYNIYRCQRTGIGTRYGKKYDWIRTALGVWPGAFYASATMRDETCAILHSTSRVPEELPVTKSFLETLESFGNSSLRENLLVDDDRE